MTYNQIITQITTLLQANSLIKTVKSLPIGDWWKKASEPVYPVAVFNIDGGSINSGHEITYSVQFFFLDKAGADREFEDEVINDQLQIAQDTIRSMRGLKRLFTVPDSIQWKAVADSWEEFMAGVEVTFEITAQSDFDGCDVQ